MYQAIGSFEPAITIGRFVNPCRFSFLDLYDLV
jgi:hypothetical protein